MVPAEFVTRDSNLAKPLALALVRGLGLAELGKGFLDDGVEAVEIRDGGGIGGVGLSGQGLSSRVGKGELPMPRWPLAWTWESVESSAWLKAVRAAAEILRAIGGGGFAEAVAGLGLAGARVFSASLW